jgi:hypothetical protein
MLSRREPDSRTAFCRTVLLATTRVGVVSIVCLLLRTQAFAQDLTAYWNGVQNLRNYTSEDFDRWLEKYRDAKPDFKPGDVLTAKDLERMRPFVPPGWLEQYNFPEFRMEIIPYRDHTPRKDYVECTEKYQNQVRLAKNGAIQNYTCGQPFANSSLSVNEPMSGYKAGWNFTYRWQNFGFMDVVCPVTWVRYPGTHEGYKPAWEPPPGDWSLNFGLNFFFVAPKESSEAVYGGGGAFERTIVMFYQRTYFTHLAALASQGGLLPVPGATDIQYKEFDSFYEPFDIRGTAFITYRYDDPGRADDAWAYIPNLRRVRRISIEVKSDSLLGTDHTLEDFYSFSGRVMEWNWRFLGWKDALVVHDSKYDYQHTYGPNGLVANDVWSLRHFAVVERTPKLPRHPYSRVVMFWDTQSWDASYQLGWDKKGKLWKVWWYQKRWSEDEKAYASSNRGVRTDYFEGVQVVDVQNDRGTLWPCDAGGFPEPSARAVSNIYDINKLEALHR